MDANSKNSRLQHQIDACRASNADGELKPRAADLALPEMKQLAASLAAEHNADVAEHNADAAQGKTADALQQSLLFDQAVGRAFRDVQPPAGLAGRLLAGVLGETTAEEVSQPADNAPASELDTSESDTPEPQKVYGPQAVTPADALEHEPSSAAQSQRADRRTALAVLGCAVAAVAALVLVWVIPAPVLSLSDFNALVNDEGGWIDRSVARDEETWGDFQAAAAVTEEAIASHPASNAVRVRPQQWRGFHTRLDASAVAYDLRASRTSRKAILFVVKTRTNITGLPASPSRRPHIQTGGWAISSWREGDLVYVLAVEGDAPRYRRLIRLPHFS